jgi:hypothetical protein
MVLKLKRGEKNGGKVKTKYPRKASRNTEVKMCKNS